MRFLWASDIHLNFLDRAGLEHFIREIRGQAGDALALSGDIAEGHTLESFLITLQAELGIPIYFVLGNHDFWFSGFAKMAEVVQRMHLENPQLVPLSLGKVVDLGKGIGLIGHDGWYDGRFGDFFNSPVKLRDCRFIEELRGLDPADLFDRLNQQGDRVRDFFASLLPTAFTRFNRLFLLIHVSPFQESCLFEGRVGNKDWLPFFTNKALADFVLEWMGEHPEKELNILAGHTHSHADVRILDNVRVRVAYAEYEKPRLAEVFVL